MAKSKMEQQIMNLKCCGNCSKTHSPKCPCFDYTPGYRVVCIGWDHDGKTFKQRNKFIKCIEDEKED